jgi:hypothetical protein
MIDSVDRRHQDILQDNAEFVPPVLSSPDNVIASLETGETMAQRRTRTEREMRANIAQFDVEFKVILDFYFYLGPTTNHPFDERP